jgi:hypothetical protein
MPCASDNSMLYVWDSSAHRTSNIAEAHVKHTRDEQGRLRQQRDHGPQGGLNSGAHTTQAVGKAVRAL